MKPWLKLGSVAVTLAFLAACSSDLIQETTDAPALTTQAGQTLTIRFSEDDAEQRHDNGNTLIDGPYLELGERDLGPQTVGLRFREVNIPQGAKITDARLELTGSQDSVGSATLSIRGHASDDSPAYVAALSAHNIDSRSKTVENRTWIPGTLLTGDVYTPNVTGIVQEIVNRGGWKSGNALSFMIAGSGQRQVYSYDGSATSAPRLVVSYESPSTLDPEIAAWQTKLETALAKSSAGSGVDLDIKAKANTGNLYAYSRDFNNGITSLITAYRINKDPDTALYIKEAMNIAYSKLKDEHRMCTDGTINCPYSSKTVIVRDGYRNYVRYLASAESTDSNGTDWHEMDEMMTHSVLAAAAHTLEQAGYTSAAADWTNYLENDFEAKWRDRENKAPGTFPFLTRDLMHPYAQWIRYHFYMYKLTGKSAYYTEAKRMASVVERNMRPVSTTAGEGYVWDHRVQLSGSASGACQPTNYARLSVQAFQDLAMLDSNLFDTTFMRKIANTMAYKVMKSSSGDPLADDVCGNATYGNTWPYTKWPYAAVAPWDTSGRLESALRSAEGRVSLAPYNVPAMMIHSLGR